MIESLHGARILVTGGAGLVGSHIVDALVDEGAEVIVYDSLVRGKVEHLADAMQRGEVQLVQGDIRDRDLLMDVMQGIDYVFHQAAAWLRQCQAEPRLSVDVNIVGTFNVLEACVERRIKKIVAASSSSVYGEGLYLPTDEDHPYNNDLFYGASKVANEQYYRAFYKKYGLNFVAFRYLNVYGPKQPTQAAYMDVIMHFLNRIFADEPPQIHGDGTATVDLVYVGDCARANVMALKSDVTNEFFNVATEKPTSIRELAQLLIRICGKEGQLEPQIIPRDSDLVTHRLGSTKKAREMLGFEATTTVEEGMRKTVAWYQNQRERVS
jgi:UDP-glucose 4-epimerase